jgi:hypothetical protein
MQADQRLIRANMDTFRQEMRTGLSALHEQVAGVEALIPSLADADS